MIRIIRTNIWLVIITIAVLFFFQKTILSGLLPIPSDTIVGLYHPFRDVYAKNYPRGIPFKNFLITDPVRQIIPWKGLAIDSLSKLELPLWNPYEMAGKPLLGNFQSSPFYPLNFLLFIKPFEISWSVFIIIQPLLAAGFLFLYLRNLKLDDRASFLGAMSFSFSGFFVAWLEWGNILHTALWLPLILLSIDKIFGIMKHESRIMDKKTISWSLVLLFSLVSSFFAGHLQTFFYLYILSIAYFIFRWVEHKRNVRILIKFLILNSLFIILTSVQSIPTLQFISLSARTLDQNPLATEGWFLPWQNLAQFVAPDFFGNPATLNYWGIWNYTEFVGYLGIITLVFSLFAIIKRPQRESLFFTVVIIISLLFSLPTPLAKIPFQLNFPLISSSQPTRLIFLIVLSLSALSAIGFNFFVKNSKESRKAIVISFGAIFALLAFLWIVSLGGITFFKINAENLVVAKRNLIFPTIILLGGLISVIIHYIARNTRVKKAVIIAMLLLISIDLLRFASKFTPFTKIEYLYPSTKTIEFLKKDKDIFRIAADDSRIFPPNFSTHYRIQTIVGYDPLYLLNYAELIAASERGEPNINPPFGFNRIITPHNLDSPIINLLNVKYVLTFSDMDSVRFEKVLEEGKTKIYLNREYFDRAFFVEMILEEKNKGKAVKLMFDNDLKKLAIVEKNDIGRRNFTVGVANIREYSENKIVIDTVNQGDGFLVLTDSYYLTWQAKIDGKDTYIYKTDHAFRGIYVQRGAHRVEFYNSLL